MKNVEYIPVEEEEDLQENEELYEIEEESDSQEDERVSHSEEENVEQKRSRRREENRTRRQRQKKARERDKIELDFLRQRNEQLERKFSDIEKRVGATEQSNLDGRLNHLQQQIKLADDVLAKSVSAQNGEDFAEAQKIRDQLTRESNRLNYYKRSLSEKKETAPQSTIDPRMAAYAKYWMEDNQWWDPQGRDEDSRIVTAIDNQMIREAYDPTTSEYWDELSRRVEKRLPHHFEKTGGDQQSSKRSKGPQFATGGRERPLKKNEVYLSPERKQALEDAGVWDDPQLRNKYLRAYAQYDKANGG